MQIILASQSPRRKELLAKIFSDFEVKPAGVNEDFIGSTPMDTVIELSRRKALAIKGELVIGSDTVVYLDGIYYNKPNGREDAINMLEKLSGKTHQVYTGIAVKYNEKIYETYNCSSVKIKPLTTKDIEYYVDSYKPYDKAGAYGIQDDFLVDSYYGDYYNIMGLPVDCLKELLIKIGVLSG